MVPNRNPNRAYKPRAINPPWRPYEGSILVPGGKYSPTAVDDIADNIPILYIYIQTQKKRIVVDRRNILSWIYGTGGWGLEIHHTRTHRTSTVH